MSLFVEIIAELDPDEDCGYFFSVYDATEADARPPRKPDIYEIDFNYYGGRPQTWHEPAEPEEIELIDYTGLHPFQPDQFPNLDELITEKVLEHVAYLQQDAA